MQIRQHSRESSALGNNMHVSIFLSKLTNSLACIIRNLEYLRVLAAVMVIVGVYLIEPYLSLTTSSTTTWETLVLAFLTLFNDLNTTKPELLLHLTTPCFLLHIHQGEVQQLALPLLPPPAHGGGHQAVSRGDLQHSETPPHSS